MDCWETPLITGFNLDIEPWTNSLDEAIQPIPLTSVDFLKTAWSQTPVLCSGLWVYLSCQNPPKYTFQKWEMNKTARLFSNVFSILFSMTQRRKFIFICRSMRKNKSIPAFSWRLSNRSCSMHHPFKFDSLHLHTLELERSLIPCTRNLNDCLIFYITLLSQKTTDFLYRRVF